MIIGFILIEGGYSMHRYKLKLIKRSLAIFIIIILLPISCTKSVKQEGILTVLFGEPESPFGDVTAPAAFDWKQCEGTILNFICEDNINANILSKECEEFTKVTGIKVNIKLMDFNTLEEKINMEFISKTAQYDLIYVDPYKTLNRFANGLEDLYLYEKDEALPHLVGGLESFVEEQLEVCSYFGKKDKLLSIPFDSTTMILFYRKDIFDEYQDRMEKDLGFDPEPGSSDFTWDRYIAVAQWIEENVDKEKVKYASLTMNAKHNSIYTAFSTVLGAYGGDYFNSEKIVGLGTSTGPQLLSRTTEFRTALSKFKEIVALNPKSEQGYTWDEVGNAFTAGEAAMMMNWDENISAVENSELAGKVGYSTLPKGTIRSANIYGGSGIGINRYSDSKKKLAAWMFIVWATSPEVQMKTYTNKDGGTLPTRIALRDWIAEKYSDTLPQIKAMTLSQQKDYAYYRPKMKNGYEFEDVMVTNLFQMVTEDIGARSVSIKMRSQWNERR
jgi:multiple sugar transport system substrate-binding protein